MPTAGDIVFDIISMSRGVTESYIEMKLKEIGIYHLLQVPLNVFLLQMQLHFPIVKIGNLWRYYVITDEYDN